MWMCCIQLCVCICFVFMYVLYSHVACACTRFVYADVLYMFVFWCARCMRMCMCARVCVRTCVGGLLFDFGVRIDKNGQEDIELQMHAYVCACVNVHVFMYIHRHTFAHGMLVLMVSGLEAHRFRQHASIKLSVVYLHDLVCMYACRCVSVCKHACFCVYIYIYIYIYACIYTYMHTHAYIQYILACIEKNLNV